MFRKYLAAVAMTVAALTGTLVLTAQPASAAASNCPSRPAFWDKGRGNYCVIVFGTGLKISEVSGTFTNLVHPVCNPSITAEFFDTTWKHLKTLESSRSKGCFRNLERHMKLTGTAPNGYMCSTLKDNGNRLASYCFRIKP